jgi:hypothetical protein
MSVESIDPRLIAVLLAIHDVLEGKGVRWAVMGSLNHALQGLEIQPRDIDICTDERGAYAMERLHEEYVTHRVSYKEGEGVRSHFGEFKIDGVTVEIIGDMEIRADDGVWTPLSDGPYRHVTEAEASIPVRTLEQEVETYIGLGRVERAEKLRELFERCVKDHG